MNHRHREGEEIQTKVIDNLLNGIITENFPNLEKESHTGTVCLQNPKKNTNRHIIIKTLSIQNKERILKIAREKRSHI
jgi:hypothetical protein